MTAECEWEATNTEMRMHSNTEMNPWLSSMCWVWGAAEAAIV